MCVRVMEKKKEKNELLGRKLESKEAKSNGKFGRANLDGSANS